jgi:hypothetical protein
MNETLPEKPDLPVAPVVQSNMSDELSDHFVKGLIYFNILKPSGNYM